jgi:hypothetical protein
VRQLERTLARADFGEFGQLAALQHWQLPLTDPQVVLRSGAEVLGNARSGMPVRAKRSGARRRPAGFSLHRRGKFQPDWAPNALVPCRTASSTSQRAIASKARGEYSWMDRAMAGAPLLVRAISKSPASAVRSLPSAKRAGPLTACM